MIGHRLAPDDCAIMNSFFIESINLYKYVFIIKHLLKIKI